MNVESISAGNFENRFNELMNNQSTDQISNDSIQKFDDIFDSLTSMKETQETTKNDMANVLMGKTDNAYDALMSMEKDNLQMKFSTNVRDKMVGGMNTLLNMQI